MNVILLALTLALSPGEREAAPRALNSALNSAAPGRALNFQLSTCMPDAQMMEDGDSAFLSVDTQTPAHQLAPGVWAEAVNKRSEQGQAWPRFGVGQQRWGLPGALPTVAGTWSQAAGFGVRATVTGLVVGRTYLYEAGNSIELTSASMDIDGLPAPSGTVTTAGRFVAAATSLYLWGAGDLAGDAVTARIFPVANPCGLSRWKDPDGFDQMILVTDEARNGGSEDGGRGRAWRILPGQAPQEIDLNGHDVWGTSRLIPCVNGLVLLRQGNERHYFNAAAVDTSGSTIQLNCAQNWVDGDRVFFQAAETDSYVVGTSPPAVGTEYFVKLAGSSQVKLYTDSALTTQLTGWTAVNGSFYLERRAFTPGFYGNGAPPLLMQPDISGGGQASAFEIGFKAVLANVAATAFNGTTKVLTAPNHRLIPGDGIKYHHSNNTEETFYVNPIGQNEVMLYASAILALAGGAANAQSISPGFNSADYLYKTAANGLPMPPGREGVGYLGRTVIVNERFRVAISDALDPLHFAPMSATVNAALGEGDSVASLIPLGVDPSGRDILIVGKEDEILGLVGLSGSAANWALKPVTKEYGLGASLATIQVGEDVWGLSRKGVVSVTQTTSQSVAGVAQPVSMPMKKYHELIDWRNYQQGAAETWNNRAFFAVPLKGQTAGTIRNNGVLVYNTLTQGWEGLWEGDALEIYDWARCKVFGEERLCFVNYEGQVCWFTDGWTDFGDVAISDSMVSRTYTKGSLAPKLWLKGKVIWETQNPSLQVTAVSPGHNEEQQVLPVGSGRLTYDGTQYLVYGREDYDPTGDGARFDESDREDYALTANELTAGALDAHQNIPESFRMRVNDWGVQIRIENTQGSCRVVGVQCVFVATERVASRTS